MPKRRSAALAATLLIGAATAVAQAPNADASTTVSGYVTCIDQLPVAGVWIAASGGSGFASWYASGTDYNAHFSRSGISGSWTVHVGCGQSGGGQWTYTANGNVNVSNSYQSWTCYTADIVHYPFCQTS